MTKLQKTIGVFLVFAFLLGVSFTPFMRIQSAKAGVLQDLLDAIQEKAPEASKNIILTLLDTIDKFLNDANTRVDVRRGWSDTQKSTAHDKINEGLAWSAEVRAKVEAVDMSSDTALTEYKTIYEEAKAKWDVYRVELKRVWADILIENGQKILDSSKLIRDRMEKIATKLEETNSTIDTSHLSNLIQQLSAEIEQSEEYFAVAVEEVDLLANTTGTEAIKHYLDGRTALLQANLNLLTDGRALLEDIILEIQRLFQEVTNSTQ